MIKNARLNSLYSKKILDYCKISTQESIKKMIKTNYINKKNFNIQDENKCNNNKIFTIYMLISTSYFLFYLNKRIT